MAGHKIKLPKGTRLKGGKLVGPIGKLSVSKRIAQRKSKRTKVVRRTV